MVIAYDISCNAVFYVRLTARCKYVPIEKFANPEINYKPASRV